jgi:hypothetical protein
MKIQHLKKDKHFVSLTKKAEVYTSAFLFVQAERVRTTQINILIQSFEINNEFTNSKNSIVLQRYSFLFSLK